MQCPRNYFFKYIKEVPTKSNLDQFRGKLIHSILETFFDLDFDIFSNANFEIEIKMVLMEKLNQMWLAAKKEIDAFGNDPERVKGYFYDSQKMISNYVDLFARDIHNILHQHNLRNAMKILTPEREVHLESKKYFVHGFLDAVHKRDKTVILDYKTTSKDDIKDSYKNQLAIYALLYKENFNKLPDEVRIHFLMHGIKTIPADDAMVKHAINLITKVHKSTLTDDIKHYTMNKSPLCKWHSGQCDFYEICSK
jgi:CRISPR/Cas system-associated exonuclease Cas4 (RecB family)